LFETLTIEKRIPGMGGGLSFLVCRLRANQTKQRRTVRYSSNHNAVKRLMNHYRNELTRSEENKLIKTGSHEVRGSIPLGSTNSALTGFVENGIA
jgi:hypothetical protein